MVWAVPVLIVIHVSAVFAKLGIFFVVPRLQSVDEVRRFLNKYKPYERVANWILWWTGGGLLYFAGWNLLRQTWMLVSIGLYLIVFLAIRFGLVRDLRRISESKKLLATNELRMLRVNNWCVGILSVAILGVIAYLMMTKP